MDLRKIRGQSGESIALAYLEARGFQLIERNWTCRLGEIDLIVKRDEEVRFVEVKMRRTLEYGYPEASITQAKLRHFSRAIECWLLKQKKPPRHYQGDAIAIFMPFGHEPEIVWIEGVL